MATKKGHMKHIRKNNRSTKIQDTPPNEDETMEKMEIQSNHIFAKIINPQQLIATNLNGRFPVTSNKGNKYLIIFGEGKPTPPTVIPMRHAISVACTEQEAPCHRPVRQGGGKEAKTAGGGGAAGEFGEGLPGLRGTVGDCDTIQISGKGADGGGRQLNGSGRQPDEG